MMTDDDVARGTSLHRSMTHAMWHAETAKLLQGADQNSPATVRL
jgi:hypothetical protein